MALTLINWIEEIYLRHREICVALSLAMSYEACDAEPWYKGVSGGQTQRCGVVRLWRTRIIPRTA